MEIMFIASGHRREPSLVTCDDGVRLTVPVFGPLEPIPHDLAHYVVERELGLQDGFWGTVAAGGLFVGMRVIAGRQRPHLLDRSGALMKANHRAIIFAEVVVGEAICALRDEPPVSGPLPVDYPGMPMRTSADRLALRVRVRPAMEEMCARWRAVPSGDVLTLTWRTLVTRHGASSRSPAQHHSGRDHVRPVPHW